MGSQLANGQHLPEGMALRQQGITKSFGETHALKAVSFHVNRGEIHALVGSNGSGKSTLVKILAGVYQADAGSISVREKSIDASKMTPSEADNLNLRFVHQQPSTFASMTIAENLTLGRGFEHGAVGNIHWREVRRRASAVLDRFEIDAHPDRPLATLRPAKQTMVEIARALQDREGSKEGILVLDEPTASLPEPEVRLLLDALGRYAAAGQTIIYVTHRLDEVMEISDRVSVLRDGSLAATKEIADVSHEDLVELICGRPVDSVFPEASASPQADFVLEVRGLRGGPIKNANLTVRRGEIVGLAGLIGSGRSSLLRMVFGDLPPEMGEIKLAGTALVAESPSQAMRTGVGYVPESRASAAFEEMTVTENLSAATVRQYWRRGLFRHRAERRDAGRLMERFGVKAASARAAFGSLSGGNQQKAILARWLRREPFLLLLDEPTQGVDVGARVEIYRTIRDAAEGGTAVLLASSDFEELAGLCDRVVVVANGQTVQEARDEDLESSRLQELTYAPTGAS